METTVLAALAVAAALALVPLAGAHDAGCPAEATVLTVHTLAGGFYVTGDGSVHQESNGHPGLQRDGGACGDDARLA